MEGNYGQDSWAGRGLLIPHGPAYNMWLCLQPLTAESFLGSVKLGSPHSAQVGKWLVMSTPFPHQYWCSPVCSFLLSAVVVSDVLVLFDQLNVYLLLVPSCNISGIRDKLMHSISHVLSFIFKKWTYRSLKTWSVKLSFTVLLSDQCMGNQNILGNSVWKSKSERKTKRNGMTIWIQWQIWSCSEKRIGWGENCHCDFCGGYIYLKL